MKNTHPTMHTSVFSPNRMYRLNHIMQNVAKKRGCMHDLTRSS